MKIKFNQKLPMNPRMIMRRCGYGEIPTREISYAKRLGRQEYPRFHVYLNITDDGFEISLHLDQKKPSYGQNTAHSGEYDGELVEAEAKRIQDAINSL